MVCGVHRGGSGKLWCAVMVALVDNSARAYAQRGLVGRCPHCFGEVVPKCGEIVCWHWAHKSSRDCNSWAEMSDWHIGWQSRFPIELCEIPIGEHRADVRLPNGRVIEFQHSPVAEPDIEARERHYGSMVWVFDAVGPHVSIPLKCHALASVVLSPRARYRPTKKAGSAIHRTIKQTKAAISILLPSVWLRNRAFRRRGFLLYDTRATGPKFNRVHRVVPLVGCDGGAGAHSGSAGR